MNVRTLLDECVGLIINSGVNSDEVNNFIKQYQHDEEFVMLVELSCFLKEALTPAPLQLAKKQSGMSLGWQIADKHYPNVSQFKNLAEAIDKAIITERKACERLSEIYTGAAVTIAIQLRNDE